MPEGSKLVKQSDEILKKIFEKQKNRLKKAEESFTKNKTKYCETYGQENINVILGGEPSDSFENPTTNVRAMKEECKGLFKEAEYLKILAFVKIAFKTEQNGNPEEEALKLALIFDDAHSALKYLEAYANVNKTLIDEKNDPNDFQLVHDACLFTIPGWHDNKLNKKVFQEWKSLSKKRNNLTSKEFRKLLPNAESLSKQIEGNTTGPNDPLKNKLEGELRDVLNGCDIYLQEDHNLKDNDLSKKLKEDVIGWKKVILVKVGDEQYKLYYTTKERKTCQTYSLTPKDIQAIDEEADFSELKFESKLSVLKRNKKNVYVNDSLAELVGKQGGEKPQEGQNSLRRRKSDLFADEEDLLSSLNQKMSVLRVQLAKECYGQKAVEQMTIDQLKAYYELLIVTSKPEYKFFLENGLSPKDFEKFLKLDRNKAGKNIPDVTIDGEKIPKVTIKGQGVIDCKGYYLKKINVKNHEDAARAACLGKLTDCCQSLSGEAGEPCAIHGLTDPNGGFYVICRGDADNPKVDDPIVAQSWVWRSPTGAIVCDSVEVSPACMRMNSMISMVIKMYDALGAELIKNHQVPRVNVGTNTGISDRVGVDMASFSSFSPENPNGYTGYRDSSTQRLLVDKKQPFFSYKNTLMASEIESALDKLVESFNNKVISDDDANEFITFLKIYSQDKNDPNISTFFNKLMNRVDLNKVANEQGKTILMFVAEDDTAEKCVDVLLEKCVDPLLKDNDGKTFFDYLNANLLLKLLKLESVRVDNLLMKPNKINPKKL